MKFNEGAAISAKLFSWERGHGYAEISDLGPKFALHQVWPDSCDGGFTITSERTNERRTFVEYNQERDAEGELLSTRFISLNVKSGRIDTTPNALWITLWND